MKLTVNNLAIRRSITLIVALLFTTIRLFSQKEVEYINPPLISSEYYTIEIKEILATSESFKFELVIENKSSDKVLLLDPSKISIYFNDVAYYPVKSGLVAKITSKEDPVIMIAPKSKKKEGITVEGNANFKLDAVKIVIPNISYNGTLLPAPTLPAYTVSALPKVVDPAIGDVNIVELEFKKTKWTAKLDLVRNSTNEIILVDLTKIKGISKTGAQLPTTAKSPLGVNKYDFNNDKIALKPNVDYKLSLSIDDLEGSLNEISLAGVFERYSIAELTIAPITVRKVGSDVTKVETPKTTPPPVQQSTTVTQSTPVQQSAPVTQSTTVQQSTPVASNSQQCAPFVGNPAAGKVKVNFYNNDGYCFEVLSPGSSYTNGPTNNATIYFNYGKANIIIKMNGSIIIQEEIKTNQNLQAVSYMIKEKKGEWSLDRKDVEITAEAQARMDKMEADSDKWHEENKKESEAWQAEQSAKHQELVKETEKDDDEEEGSSSTKSSGNSGTSGSGSKNTNISGSGSTTFTITYKGTPVCNTDISFIQGGSRVAGGTTNDNGEFKSDFNGAIGVAFTVKGQRNNTTWEIKDFYALPNNDSEIGLRLEDFEKQMEEMTKMVGEEDSEMGAIMGGFTTAVSVAAWGVTDGCK
ncbi:MAG: hypothetical protein QE487_17030 [Fluviicola sp.]|nr:hypothetical protein [Fluviicola sp.]